jgi:hypothetical protein
MSANLAVVVVKFEGATCVPHEAWLVREDDGSGRQFGGYFDVKTRIARIKVRGLNGDTSCRVYSRWAGSVLASAVFMLKAGETEQVALVPPEGAQLRVRVLGPYGRPPDSAEISVRCAGSILHALTDDTGVARFAPIPAPVLVRISVDEFNGETCCVQQQAVTLQSAGDRHEALFDLTGTGVVDYDLRVRGRFLQSFEVAPINADGGVGDKEWMYLREGLIYGLKPGRYRVTTTDHDTYRRFTADFDVTLGPALSFWHKDFETHTLTVRVQHAPLSSDLRLRFWGGDQNSYPLEPEPTGEFVVRDLASGEVELVVSGGGWASEVVRVDPSQQNAIDISLAPSGTLKLVPRGDQAFGAYVVGIEPARVGVRVTGDGLPRATVMELIPGRYRVTDRWRDAWTPVEVRVAAGQTTECHVGIEFTCRVQLRLRDRAPLWDYTTRIEQNDKVIQTRMFSTGGSDGDLYYTLEFAAEGKFKLRITGDAIEDFEREFEVERNKTVSLEIDLKRKQ